VELIPTFTPPPRRLVPVLTGSRPVPQPNWGYDVAQRDLYRLQPLHEIVQQLLRGGLTGTNLLQTFFNHRVQPLRQQEMAMWMYLGPICPDRPFSVELGNTEINTRVQGVLAHGADLNLGSGPVPLREGDYLCQFLFLNVCVFLCRISGMLTAPYEGGHLTSGCGKVGGLLYLQRMVVGTEAKVMGLERRSDDVKGTGGGQSLRARILRRVR
jgi:hypothetical protein